MEDLRQEVYLGLYDQEGLLYLLEEKYGKPFNFSHIPNIQIYGINGFGIYSDMNIYTNVLGRENYSLLSIREFLGGVKFKDFPSREKEGNCIIILTGTQPSFGFIKEVLSDIFSTTGGLFSISKGLGEISTIRDYERGMVRNNSREDLERELVIATSMV